MEVSMQMAVLASMAATSIISAVLAVTWAANDPSDNVGSPNRPALREDHGQNATSQARHHARSIICKDKSPELTLSA
jgi:hypothetical protein